MKEARYRSTEFCMSFSTEEIEEGFLAKLKNIPGVHVQADYDGPNGAIDYVSLSEQGDLAVRFYGFETSIFIYDEKIMLIDDMQRRKYTLDHTYGNVVYDGSLRNLTHAEILELLVALTKCFVKCVRVHVEGKETTPAAVNSCGAYSYILSVVTENTEAEQKVFSNIEIHFISQECL